MNDNISIYATSQKFKDFLYSKYSNINIQILSADNGYICYMAGMKDIIDDISGIYYILSNSIEYMTDAAKENQKIKGKEKEGDVIELSFDITVQKDRRGYTLNELLDNLDDNQGILIDKIKLMTTFYNESM